MSPQDSRTEVLTLSVTVFGGGPLGGDESSVRVHEGAALTMG